MNAFEGFSDSLPEMEPRDYLFSLKPDFDPDSQLIAIGSAVQRNRRADEAQAKEIQAIEEHARHLKGLSGEWAVDSWVDELHHSTYQSAAHGMAAVGMVAPVTETIFFQCFRGIGREFFPASNPVQQHARWNSAHAVQWDCHFVVTHKGPEKDIVRGIIQLPEAVGLLPKLPADLRLTLSALFGYRNSMFHNGFEWLVEERQRFAKRMATEHWPTDWFFKAEVGNEPLIF